MYNVSKQGRGQCVCGIIWSSVQKEYYLWVRSVFNIWVGLWSSKCVYSVCVMLCLGSVHELRKWDLASAELYRCLCTWKQLVVNCGG